jgi:multidrug resistance efflux pump
VSPQITGRLTELSVREGDTVKAGQMLAVLSPDELREERAFYSANAEGVGSQIQESEAALRLQERQTTDSIAQAEATLASTQSQEAAAKAELENATITFQRNQKHLKEGVSTPEQVDSSRTAYDVAKSRLEAVGKQIEAARAAVALAKGSAEQIAMRRSQVAAGRKQQARPPRSAGEGRRPPRLHRDQVTDRRHRRRSAPRCRRGRHAGQPLVTIINPDDLWVRIDVEETYIDRLRNGDMRTVRLPSGVEMKGTVFLPRRRCRLRDAARREPHETRHQDVRDAAACRQQPTGGSRSA